jgi:hypothetical protein
MNSAMFTGAGVLPAAVRILGLCLAGLLAAPAMAFDFKPTPAEWTMWSDYCKARYVQSSVGKTSPYAAMVPPSISQMWRTRLGDATFDPLHHHCAGLIYMQRARLAPNDQQRVFNYRSAQRESSYTLQRIPPTSPLYREVLGNVQMAQAMLGVYGYSTAP